MKVLFTLFLLATIITGANATTYIVTCQNNPSHFLPVIVNAHPGDTIHWKWLTGGHIVGPINATYIPAGAPMFNSPVDNSHRNFKYKVTVPGTYNYDCHPAGPHGEVAKIVVTAVVSGVASENKDQSMQAFPNPSLGKFSFLTKSAELTKSATLEIYDLKGDVIYQSKVTDLKSDIDLSRKNKGLYFIRFANEYGITTKKILIQ